MIVIDLATLPIGLLQYILVSQSALPLEYLNFSLSQLESHLHFMALFFGTVSGLFFFTVAASASLLFAAFLHPYLNRSLPFVHANLSLATF